MKKIAALLLMTAVMIGGIFIPHGTVYASDRIDGSNLVYEDSSEGNMNISSYGAYLQAGMSNINKTGPGQAYAKGTTIAQRTVSKISVTVRLERLLGSAWVQEASFSATKYNDYEVNVGKTLPVSSGFFYRVKSIHTANTDSSSSWTDGLYF